MRLTPIIAAAAMSLVAAPLAAQVEPSTAPEIPAADDSSLEKNLKDMERDRIETRGNDTASRLALAEWGGCLARKNSAEAGRILAMDFTTPTYDRAFRMLTDEDKQCRGFKGTLRTQRLLLAGELAEALIAQAGAPLANKLAQAAARPATPAFSFTDRVAICVVRSAPSQVAALFSTARNSAEENTAAQALAMPTGLCAKAAEARRPLAINPAGLRAMLATAAFRTLRAA